MIRSVEVLLSALLEKLATSDLRAVLSFVKQKVS